MLACLVIAKGSTIAPGGIALGPVRLAVEPLSMCRSSSPIAFRKIIFDLPGFSCLFAQTHLCTVQYFQVPYEFTAREVTCVSPPANEFSCFLLPHTQGHVLLRVDLDLLTAIKVMAFADLFASLTLGRMSTSHAHGCGASR